MRFVRALDERLNAAESGLLVVLLAVMLVLAFVQVVLRNAFESGLLWADILLRHIVLWLGFLGGALATSKQRHIHIDAFAHFMSPRVKAWIGVFSNLFGAVVCAILARASVEFVLGEVEAGSVVYDQIPSWYAQIIIPVGFGLHVLHFLIRSVLSAEAATKGGDAA